jgi:hypothetical protein
MGTFLFRIGAWLKVRGNGIEKQSVSAAMILLSLEWEERKPLCQRAPNFTPALPANRPLPPLLCPSRAIMDMALAAGRAKLPGLQFPPAGIFDERFGKTVCTVGPPGGGSGYEPPRALVAPRLESGSASGSLDPLEAHPRRSRRRCIPWSSPEWKLDAGDMGHPALFAHRGPHSRLYPAAGARNCRDHVQQLCGRKLDR